MKLPTLYMWAFAAWLFMVIVMVRLSIAIVDAFWL